jgi:predicted extracellular nuclease
MAATTLSVGDIAIVGYITNGSPDSFSFVNLVPIGSGTVIYFTDNGWTGTQFRGSSATDGDGNENLIRFTAISDIPAGTVIRSTDTSANYTWAKSGQIGTTIAGSYADLSLSQSGEQIAAFQSTNTNNPLNSGFTAIYQIDNTGTFENATTASEGNIITGLSQASNSAVLFNNISATYAAFNLNILSSGTKAQWLAAINNSSNWTFSNLTALPTGSITVGSGTTQPDLTVSLSSPTSVTVNNSFDYTLVVSNAGNANASGISVQFTLPSGVTFNSTGGSGFTSSQNSGVVTFSGGSINASGSATLTVNVTPTTTGTLTTGTAIVDPSNTIVESNDNNNTAAAISTTVNPITPSNTAPTILADNETVIDADKITPFLSLPNNSPTATPAAFVSGVINDLTDPAKTIGIEFNVSDAETDAGSLTVTATSSNTAVVENANLTLTGTGTSRNLKINPTGVGFSDITVTVSDGNLSSSYVIKYAASAAGSTTTRFLTGTSDASSAIAIDADYMFVADDEDQTIRLYDRNDSGLPLSSFDFTSSLGLFGSSEVDIEASTKIGNIIYWIGSHSNNSSGNDRPNRERIFSTTISGTGASTTLTFGGYYQFLEDDLIAWDNTNGHGLGAGFLGLAASAANNVVPEQSNGFNIEGFTVAPNGTTGYIAFRAPNEPTTDRTKALIVPVTNFTSILNGSGGTAGSATFGAPIQLDLGGRGIRSIERNANNEYLIIAGPAGAATGTAPNDFRLYTWTGVATDAPVLRSADLTALNAGGSFETIVEVPNSLTSSTQLQFLVDNGDSDWYSNGTISKDLAQTNFQKFRSELINLGTAILPTKISEIQGTGTAATAGTYTIEGIVVGDFQGANQLGGFYLQEEDTDADGNVLTSEAIFVISSTAVNVGDKVRLTGTVVENSSTPSFNQAVITPTSVSVLATGQQALVTATVLDLPTASFGDLERYEGMLVTIPETLTVTEVFNLGRFGEVSLSANGRLPNPTNIIDPNDSPASGTSSTGNSNVAAVTAQQDLNNRSRIILDDGSSASNLSDVPYVNTTDGDLTNDTLRIGSTIAGLTGVVGFGFNNYRIQATQTPVFNYEARPTLPTVGGSLKVSTFNVLNYFNGDGLGGGFPTSRGADSAAEFSRQRAKIIAAIQSLNADVVGLVEIENDGDGANSAIADLVNGLNAAMGAGTYAFTSLANTTGSSGTDEIKVAFIYKPSAVTPVGNAVYFNDPAFTSLGRPPLAQTFSVIATGEKFTPIVNHFKSKSASGATGLDADQGDGQGAYNNTRKTQATALLNFVSQIQTASGDGDVMILGDLNAYNEEDPIDILRAAGFTKLTTATDSYVFDGQTGSLDHALVSASLVSQVTGAAKWNINSSEPIAFDYNDNVADSGEANTELRNDTSLYSATPFRSSDHDPVLVGLNLYSAIAPTNLSLSATSINENVAVNNVNNVIGTFSTTDPNVNDTFTYSFVNGVNDNATFSINGSQLLINASPNFEAKSSYNILVRTTDNSGLSFDKSLTININDVNEAPTVVSLNNQVTAIAENTSTATRIKVADIAITDDALGTNTLSVSGTDASFFEISGNALYLKANTALNFEAKTSYNVTVNVDDSTVGNTPDATANFTLNITDVNEAPTAVNLNNQVTAIAENTSTTTRIKVADIAITNDALGTNSLSVSGTDASFFLL